MKKRYVFLVIVGALAATPFGFRAGRKAKDKLADWHDRLVEMYMTDL